ncbi:hypothetical protein [Nocardia nova]|uniref:hypothetical protein n=1 Tax=Nocardia nova TaxID=37330 RepID=UPI0011B02E40|nr:hypothetical protein [Nocardia nova]
MKRDTRILFGLGTVCAAMVVVAGVAYSSNAPRRTADPAPSHTPPFKTSITSNTSTEVTSAIEPLPPKPTDVQPVFVTKTNIVDPLPEPPEVPAAGLSEAKLTIRGGWSADIVMRGDEVTCKGGLFEDPRKGGAWRFIARRADNTMLLDLYLQQTPQSMRSNRTYEPAIMVQFKDDRGNIQRLYETKDSAPNVFVVNVVGDRLAVAFASPASVYPYNFWDPSDRISAVAVSGTFSCGMMALPTYR